MIYIFYAHGFEEIEAIACTDILRRAELDVRTVGVGAKTITGAHGITLHCDMIDHKVSTKDLEMIVLPGGMPGTLNLEKAESVRDIIRYAVENNLYIGAICAAPSILGHMDLLDGKNVTCYPGLEKELGGANHTGARVERDEKLVTGNGPDAAVDFALKLVECLKGEECAQTTRAAL